MSWMLVTPPGTAAMSPSISAWVRLTSGNRSGVIAVHSVGEAVAQASASEELVAIGGAEVYRLLLPLARRIYLTHVHADVPGDITFPEFDSTQWADVECSSQPADEAHAYPLTFVTLERRYAPETPWRH